MNKSEIIKLINECENEVREEFLEVDKLCEKNTFKVLEAFKNNNVKKK